MQPELIKITEQIFLLVFENQYEITSTFLRFQEHYESPKFRGKIFTLEEFKKWYASESPKGRETGKFSYYSDWNGFNIPSYVLEPFYEGKFHPLSEKEQMILELFKQHNSKFYIIGIHRECNNIESFLVHEIAHGYFHTDKDYQEEVLAVLKKFDLSEMKETLFSKYGYHPEVLDDECHAYGVDGENNLEVEIPEDFSAKLTKIFRKYLEKGEKSLSDIITHIVK